MLEVDGLDVRYGATQVLWDVSLRVGAGEIVAMLGPNGCGKSTVLKAIMGLVPPSRGRVRLDGAELSGSPAWERVGRGMSLVLERRRLFPRMSVRENVMLGAFHRGARAAARETYAWVEDLFPILAERAEQRAGALSGGEQQQVAIARGLMARPRLMLMDEPFLGLSPVMVRSVLALMRRINREGIAIVFNEQNVKLSFGNADRGYLMEGGRVRLEGSGLEMLEHEVVRRVYLGVPA